jgi:hypothetical protein
MYDWALLRIQLQFISIAHSCIWEVAKYRLLEYALILTAELYAIHQEWALQDFVIYSDSLSRLYPTRHQLLNQIKDVIHDLAVQKNITFVWVPGYWFLF